MSTSAPRHSRLSTAAPCCRFRSSAKERLPRACTSAAEVTADWDRRSTRTTCAPKSARIIPQSGAGASPASSSTRTPLSAIATAAAGERLDLDHGGGPEAAPPALARRRGQGAGSCRPLPGATSPASPVAASSRAREALRLAVRRGRSPAAGLGTQLLLGKLPCPTIQEPAALALRLAPLGTEAPWQLCSPSQSHQLSYSRGSDDQILKII